VPLPLKPPVLPQLARPAKTLPTGAGWAFEPKWDGFRAVVFQDGDESYVQSRNGKPLSRYFPELRLPPGRFVLDGEIVVLGADGAPDFDALGQRIHPAKSRIDLLAEETPATLMAFDLLAVDDEVLLELPLSERRARLEQLVGDGVGSTLLTELVRTTDEAEHWLHDAEGVIAKQLDAPYRPGERVGMAKIKRLRTIDAVVAGWRPGKHEGTVGALILGLYDADGDLHIVGHCSGLSAKEKKSLVGELRPYETGERGSGEASRWTQGRELEWVSLRPELVVEVTFDHVSAGRIRHGTKLLRWRDDKEPRDCSVDQLRS
jgi:ATP-dependent DNA ligase